MPSIDRHCRSTELRYKIEARDFHQWIDEPAKVCGGSHRKYRHKPDAKIPQEFIDRYGENICRDILIDHIILDSVTKGLRKGRSLKEEVVIEKDSRYVEITKLFYEDCNYIYDDISQKLGIDTSTVGVIVSRCKKRGYLPKLPKEQWTRDLIRICVIEHNIKIEGIS